ncbi:MAG: hypothetical protein IT252_04105, partial [Chitinophagaceae bacterium]|nr:hypothetical protein [Chitinophagaceae bacterium]
MQNLRMLLEHWGLYAPNASMLKQRLAVRTTLLFLLISFTGASVQAQIGVRLLDRQESSSNGFSFQSDSYTPRAGAVLLAVVTNSHGTANSGNSVAAPSGATGNGLTWTQVSSMQYAGNSRWLTVYRAYTGNNVTAGSFRVNFPGSGNGQERRSATIQVLELIGVEVTGTNASDAIAGISSSTGTSSTATITVGSTIDFAGTAMLGIFATNRNDFDGEEETGWRMLSTAEESNEDLSVGISYALNTYDNSARMTEMEGSWAALGIRLAPAEYFFNFPVVSTSTVSNGESFTFNNAGLTSRSGNANNLSLNLNNSAATFVAKSGNMTFSSAVFNNGSTFVVDQNATATLPGNIQYNGGSNAFVANGGSMTVNGALTLNNGSHLRVYGTVTINGNLQMNSSSRLFIGATGRLIINGTLTMNGDGFTLVNGGQLTSNSLVTRSTSFIEMAQGAAVETSVYEENNQQNVMRMGPGAGCFGLFGPSGRLNTQNYGFQPITDDATLKVCLPSNGVAVGNSFNSANRGSANVTVGCTG